MPGPVWGRLYIGRWGMGMNFGENNKSEKIRVVKNWNLVQRNFCKARYYWRNSLYSCFCVCRQWFIVIFRKNRKICVPCFALQYPSRFQARQIGGRAFENVTIRATICCRPTNKRFAFIAPLEPTRPHRLAGWVLCPTFAAALWLIVEPTLRFCSFPNRI